MPQAARGQLLRRLRLSVLCPALLLTVGVLAARTTPAHSSGPACVPAAPNCISCNQAHIPQSGLERWRLGCERKTISLDVNEKTFACNYHGGTNCSDPKFCVPCWLAAVRTNAIGGWNAAWQSFTDYALIVESPGTPPGQPTGSGYDIDYSALKCSTYKVRYGEWLFFIPDSSAISEVKTKSRDDWATATCTACNAKEVLKGHVYFNFCAGWTDDWKRMVSVHELGHQLGLLDAKKQNYPSVMSYPWMLAAGNPAWPQLADAEGILCLYHTTLMCKMAGCSSTSTTICP